MNGVRMRPTLNPGLLPSQDLERLEGVLVLDCIVHTWESAVFEELGTAWIVSVRPLLRTTAARGLDGCLNAGRRNPVVLALERNNRRESAFLSAYDECTHRDDHEALRRRDVLVDASSSGDV